MGDEPSGGVPVAVKEVMDRPFRVLVIDDDTVDRMAIQRALKRWAVATEVQEAENGVLGLEALTKLSLDSVFLDYRLPPSDGLRVLEQARAAGVMTPIVMLTGEGDELLAAEVLRCGASDYLSKQHLTTEALTKSIEYVTRMHHAELTRLRLASFPEQAPNPIIELDEDGRVSYLNPAAKRCFPELEQEATEHPLLEGIQVSEMAKGETTSREVAVNGGFYHQTISCTDDQRAARIYAFDISERMHAEQQLVHNAFYDEVTGLPNRALFVDRLEQALQRAQHDGARSYAVLFIDLDRFKMVNDSLGHHRGNELLVAASRRLQACVRFDDTVARFGGDEFAILVEEPRDISEVTHIGERILREFAKPFDLGEHEVFSTASIGITMGAVEHTVDEVLRDADTAMNRAKADGGGRFQVFGREMHAQAMSLLQLETELRQALERDQLELLYQPIVSLYTGELTGFEALLRWRHPQRGLIGPEEFLALAEETGVIVDLDRWVLLRSCAQVRQWRERFGESSVPTVSVNMSSSQFALGGLQHEIIGLIKSSAECADQQRLVLEITETTLMEHMELATTVLDELKGIGVTVSVDDFGTGYSSLSYLRRLPIDTLKIDRSFVSDVTKGNGDHEIIRAIIALARKLNLAVVAEGVETQEHYEAVLELQCDYGQGFYFSHPISVEEATELLEHPPRWPR